MAICYNYRPLQAQTKIFSYFKMELVGYFAAILIGISLGLIGGGGSILTLPVLVYLFAVDSVLATSYSLFIVGITSLVGTVSYFKNGLINIKTSIIFGIPSIAAVYVTRKFILPAIPDEITNLGGITVTKDLFIMALFAILMIAASYSMIKKPKKNNQGEISDKQNFNFPLIFIEGTVVGLLTGLVGAGGGFLIIPALVVLSKLPMKQAIGTSLVIIAAKSLIGFGGEAAQLDIDWWFLFTITALAIAGLFIGVVLSKKINGDQLKPAFGWFVLVMGIYILIKEFLF
jgi:uncharacterized protein